MKHWLGLHTIKRFFTLTDCSVNFINIFVDDNALLKQIKSIETDSTPLEEPKNPDTCNVFALYKLLGSTEEVADLRAKYEAGNYGYGHAKQALFELITERFKTEREKYNYYITHLDEVDALACLAGIGKKLKQPCCRSNCLHSYLFV